VPEWVKRGAIVMKLNRYIYLVGLVLLALMTGCSSGPAKAPTSAGMVVFAKGAKQYTATVMLAEQPRAVYEAMVSIVKRSPDLTVINNNKDDFLLEVRHENSVSITAQATTMDRLSTILFIWADAGDSGMTGYELARRAMKNVCDELKVECTMQDI
jgi:hypothetical protein